MENNKLRVLELYSGIGGMHYALKESNVPHEIVGAVDINDVANRIYKHNFTENNHMQRSIESLSVKEMNSMNIDMILMSPPCQPFTRVGLQKDAEDPRTKSFFHVLDLLPKLDKLPKYLLVENVKGFDISKTREKMLEKLNACGYSIQEFLLTPIQFGIPNSRLRYYMIAKAGPAKFSFAPSQEILHEVPESKISLLTHRVANPSMFSSESKKDGANNISGAQSMESCEEATECSDETNKTDRVNELEHSQNLHFEHYLPSCQKLSNFFEEKEDSYFDKYLVPEKFYKRYWAMDIVDQSSKKSCCFTKRYGHYIDGAGSQIQMLDPLKLTEKEITALRNEKYDDETKEVIGNLKLRFFTPREIANLLCFPQTFDFPADVSTIQQYRVLGNSLNVHVVSVLIQMMVKVDER